LHCGAGVLTEELLDRCESEGYRFPIDLAAKGSSQNGGNVATNAGGLEVVRYGMTRANVMGLKVVLADGSILDLTRRLEKHNVGYDLKQLFIGSEGTLGLITEVVWKVHPKSQASAHVMLPLQKPEHVSELLKRIHSASINIQRFEFVDTNSIDLVEQTHAGVKCPLESGSGVGCLILEFFDETEKRIEDWLAGLFEDGLIEDAVVPKSAAEVQNIWKVRELVSESLSAGKHLWKEDLSVPLGRLSEFLAWLHKDFRAEIASGKLYLFGHVGDGNVHVNIGSTDEQQGFDEQKTEQRPKLMDYVQSLGGSHSAEHGVGMLKRDLLDNYLSDVEKDVMAKLKLALDPDNLLNPGKVTSTNSAVK
jgi:FAD/FMN-containing dehydrogenase